MTAQPPNTLKHTQTHAHRDARTHTHTRHREKLQWLFLLWIPLATAVEKFSDEGKTEQNGEKMRIKGVKRERRGK